MKFWCIAKPSDSEHPRKSPLLFMTSCPEKGICWTYHFPKAMAFPQKLMPQAFSSSGSGILVLPYDKYYLKELSASRDPIPLEFRLIISFGCNDINQQKNNLVKG